MGFLARGNPAHTRVPSFPAGEEVPDPHRAHHGCRGAREESLQRQKAQGKATGRQRGGQQKGDGPWLGVPWEPCRARLAPCPRPEAAPWPRALGSGQIWGRLDVARRGARSLRPSLAPGTPGPVPSRAARGHRCCGGGSPRRLLPQFPLRAHSSEGWRLCWRCLSNSGWGALVPRVSPKG